MVMATSILGVKGNAIGSDVTAAPAFMVTPGMPLNLNSLFVVRLIALPPVDAAI